MSLEGKTRRELAKIWKSRIQVAQKRHKKKVKEWADKVIKEYTGDFTHDSDTGERYKQITQVVRAVEDTIQPHLFFQNPRMIAKAARTKSAWESREKHVEAVVNHEYKDIKSTGYGIELENELALIDARILGYGATETTYEVDGDMLEEEEDTGLLQGLVDKLVGAPKKKMTPVITDEKGHMTEHVCALDLILDPNAKHITKQKYVIKVMDVGLEELKKTKYEQDKIDKMKPTILNVPDVVDMSDDERKRFAEENPDFEGYRLFEIEDIENRLIYTMVDGYEDFIEFQTPHPIDEGSKYSFLWFAEGIKEVYPIPPIKFYRKRALEFSYIVTQITEQLDKLLPKIGVDINKLSKPEQEKFKSGNLGTMFATQGPPESAVKVFTSSGSIKDFLSYLGTVKELLNLESASNEYELASPEKRKATEAVQIQEGTTARRFKPKKRVQGFIKNQAHTIWQIQRRNAPLDYFIDILGDEEAREWWADPDTGKQAWMSEKAKRDFNFDFDMDSMAPMDEAVRIRQNQETLTAVLNPEIDNKLARKNKRMNIVPILERYVDQNLKIRDKSSVIEELNILSPGDEHNAWMQGQYPPITEDEMANPEKLVEHFQSHDAWINSPAFQFLPPEVQQGAIQHRDSYLPILSNLSQKREAQAPAPAPPQGGAPSEVGLQSGANQV